MKNFISSIASLLCVLVSPAFAQIVEIHEFGATNTQYFIYSSGKTFEFVAKNTMTVKTVEVKSWLASDLQATFHIELSIQDSLIAKWDQFINRDVTYKEYYHTKQVSCSLTQGDTIVYKIYGDPGYRTGGLRGVNYVKLTGEAATAIEFVDTTPSEYLLSQNYPNPFNPSTTIEFALPHSSFVTLRVYNALGEEVAALVAGDHAPGTFKATWDASGMPSGVYFYRLTAGEYVQTKKAVLMR
jgi:hypothetical protein